MKWFKHLVDSGDDPDIDGAVILFGPTGYYVFFRTIEIMSREFNYQNPGKNTFLWDFFRKKFRISARKLRENLKFFDKKQRVFCRFYKDGKVDMIDLNCPKLRTLCDEHTRKVLSKKSGVSQELVRNESQTDNRSKTTELKEQLRGQILKLNNLAKNDNVNFKTEAFFAPFVKKNDCSLKLAIEVSGALISGWSTIKTNPYAFGNGVYKNRKQNQNERDAVKQAEIFKSEWADITGEALQLTKGIG
jgi:hypothetical protein